MAKIGRPGLSREKRADLWARWKSGQCASDIARALERTKGAIHHVLAFNGGIAPGSGRCARSHVVWPAFPSYDGVLPRSWRSIGRPNRSRGG